MIPPINIHSEVIICQKMRSGHLPIWSISVPSIDVLGLQLALQSSHFRFSWGDPWRSAAQQLQVNPIGFLKSPFCWENVAKAFS